MLTAVAQKNTQLLRVKVSSETKNLPNWKLNVFVGNRKRVVRKVDEDKWQAQAIKSWKCL